MIRKAYTFGAAALMGLAGCETTTEAETVVLQRPPEYLECEKVGSELAIADERTKTLGVYDSQGAYWAKRSERLVARFNACRNKR